MQQQPMTPKELLELYAAHGQAELSAEDMVMLVENNLAEWTQFYSSRGRVIEDICPELLSLAQSCKVFALMSEQQINRIAATEWHKYNSHFESLEDERRQRLFRDNGFKSAFRQTERSWRQQPQLFHFGIDGLDAAMGGGVCAGELMSIIGNPGSMKTSLLLSGIEHWVDENGGGVAFFSLDMGRVAIVERLLAREMRCSPVAVRLQASQHSPKFEAAKASIQSRFSGKLAILENRTGLRWNVSGIKEYIERNAPKLVCVDYLTLLKTDAQSDYEIANFATSRLLDCAQMYGCALVLLSQMSVESQRLQSKGGTGGSAKGGGYVNERADIEIELFKDTGFDEFGQDNGAQIIATVKKTRKNGACASYRLDCEGEQMRFKATAQKVSRVKKKEKIFGHANTAWAL